MEILEVRRRFRVAFFLVFTWNVTFLQTFAFKWARLEVPESLLTKRKVKMAGYIGQVPLTVFIDRAEANRQPSWSNKLQVGKQRIYVFFGQKDNIFLGNNTRILSPLG